MDSVKEVNVSMINFLMEQKGLTKYRLAKISEVPYATVNDICNRKSRIEKCSAETVCKLAKALGVPMETLLTTPVSSNSTKSCARGEASVIYTISDIKQKVKHVADNYDIKKIWIFGSYFDGVPKEDSDVDLIISYGVGCPGIERTQLISDLEATLQKSVDVLNVKFLPDFLSDIDLTAERRLIYEQ